MAIELTKVHHEMTQLSEERQTRAFWYISPSPQSPCFDFTIDTQHFTTSPTPSIEEKGKDQEDTFKLERKQSHTQQPLKELST